MPAIAMVCGVLIFITSQRLMVARAQGSHILLLTSSSQLRMQNRSFVQLVEQMTGEEGGCRSKACVELMMYQAQF